MVFLTYDFVCFASVLFLAYYNCRRSDVREIILLVSGVGFLYLYGGWQSVVFVALLMMAVFYAGKSGRPGMLVGAICLCALSLIAYKYTHFILSGMIAPIFPRFASSLEDSAKSILPLVVPLGISFFTFEFVHYLVDVRKGHPPIRSPADFASFGLFWPTMVAGPIKRYEQFVPSLRRGLSGPTSFDLAEGLVRVAIGLAKKWVADNLTGWILFFEPAYSSSSISMRWVFVGALSARILLDFSGYSDIAIGFARMLGIKVPENFNWPYLARSLAEFWQRWHMSLSSWIRDYIYIPLGGNRLGLGRRVANGLTAMILCGLWHGPSWNFAVWGLYHGVGLAAGSMVRNRRPFLQPERGQPRLHNIISHAHDAISWAATLMFVAVGWLFFFYPIDRAATMAAQLFGL